MLNNRLGTVNDFHWKQNGVISAPFHLSVTRSVSAYLYLCKDLALSFSYLSVSLSVFVNSVRKMACLAFLNGRTCAMLQEDGVKTMNWGCCSTVTKLCGIYEMHFNFWSCVTSFKYSLFIYWYPFTLNFSRVR